MPLAGGAAVLGGGSAAREAFESPDGKLLYFVRQGRGIWAVPVGGGPEQVVVEGPIWSGFWSVADAGIYFVEVFEGPAPEKTPLKLCWF